MISAFRIFAFSALAAVVIAAGIAVFVSTRYLGPTRYYMPGPLGAQRATALRRQQTTAEKNGISGTPSDFGVSGPGGSDNSTAPAYLTRAIGFRTQEERTWGDRNGLTETIPFTHHLGSVFPRELYAVHPEFFPFADGKRFSPAPGYQYYNPDLGREDVAWYAAHQASRYFDAHADAVSFSLGVNDGLLFGESPETLALTGVPEAQRITVSAWQSLPPLRFFRGRPDYSPLVFTFMNRAAAQLAKTHPDKYLGCLAYYWCENGPPFPVDPHVIPFLTADRSQSYDPAFKREEFDLQERWAAALRTGGNQTGSKLSESALHGFAISSSQVTPRVGLYDYLDGQGFLIPRVPIHAFAEHIKHAHAAGFTDYYGESSRNWGLDGPMPWVIAQLLRDPSLEVDALLDEYYANYFQSAAAPMRRFFERCEQQWMQQKGPSYWLKYYRSESQAELFPPEVCGELRQLLNTAAAAAENPPRAKLQRVSVFQGFGLPAGGDRVRNRVRFVSDSFGVTERYVRFQAAREALARATLNVADVTDRSAQDLVLHSETSRSTADKQHSDCPSVKSYRLNVERLLENYTSARAEFIRYTYQVTTKWPLAFYPINWDDWLRDDPTFAANAALRTLNAEFAEEDKGRDRRSESSDIDVKRHLLNIEDSNLGPNRLASPDFSGPVAPGRRIAGLQFGVDLPAGWRSTIEPTQLSIARLREDERAAGPHTENVISGGSEISPAGRYDVPGSRVLHLSGQENATVFQWAPAQAGITYVARTAARGEVSGASNVILTIGFLDRKQHPIGKARAVYLPTGNWDHYITLAQCYRAPQEAAWAGVGIRVQHQLGSDYVDVKRVELFEVPGTVPTRQSQPIKGRE